MEDKLKSETLDETVIASTVAEHSTGSAKQSSTRDIFIINNLNLYYGTFRALTDVNMRIGEKQITAFIGPSGCGKTTFLRTLNRMNDVIPSARTEGEVEFAGENIYERNYDVIELRRKVGMVFQRPNPFPKSIYDNIVYGAKVQGERSKDVLDETVERTLREVALWDEVKDRLQKPALGLSGGQQQRLCIARCLAVEPEVILMDEPTSALDPIATLKIEELMSGLREKYTIVIVTHNMQQAGRISDITSFFLNGSVIETGETSMLFSNPENKKTEDYITGRFG